MVDADITESVIGDGCIIKVKLSLLSHEQYTHHANYSYIDFHLLYTELQNTPLSNWITLVDF